MKFLILPIHGWDRQFNRKKDFKKVNKLKLKIKVIERLPVIELQTTFLL